MGKDRDVRIDFLRLVCMVMLATYHHINYYASHMAYYSRIGMKSLIVQFFFYAGGRVICNVFMIISAWYLVDKKFKSERIIKTWCTVFIYSLFVGLYYGISDSTPLFVATHLFPISKSIVWYASAYLAVLAMSPILNYLLRDNVIRYTRNVVIVLVIFECAISTFYPGAYVKLDTFTWFFVLYLFVGLIKKGKINISKEQAWALFAVGWVLNIAYKSSFDFLTSNEAINEIFTFLGLNANIYYVRLSSAPTFLCSIGMFLTFYNLRMPAIPPNRQKLFAIMGGVLSRVAVASLDVYIVSSIESIDSKLAWVDIAFHHSYSPKRMIYLYMTIGAGIVIGVVLGNIREWIFQIIRRKCSLEHRFNALDDRISKFIAKG